MHNYVISNVLNLTQCVNPQKRSDGTYMHGKKNRLLNHKVVRLVADKLERQWLWEVCFEY